MFGFLNVLKPAGPTSHDIVDKVRRLIGDSTRRRRLLRVKVGHAGTLDPFASGVLVICLGPATRLAAYVQDQPKRYMARLTLGATSTTDDTEGEISPTEGAAAPSEPQVRDVLARHTGNIDQVPPNHSAVWVDGRRAYRIARSGKNLDLSARPVTVHGIELVRYSYPHLEIEITCSSGTYIRSLARDIGRELGCGAYCDRLARTAVGAFDISHAKPTDKINLPEDILPPIHAVAHLPKVFLDPAGAEIVSRGNTVKLGEQARLEDAAANTPAERTELALIDPAGRLLAVGRIKIRAGETFLQPDSVFFPKYGKPGV